MTHHKTLIAIALALLTLPAQAQTDTVQIPHRANVAVGVNHRDSTGELQSAFNVGLFNNVDSLRGFQLGLVSAGVRRSGSGVNLGLLTVGTMRRFTGLQASAGINFAGREMRGLQVAGLTNFARRLNGVQLSSFCNISEQPMTGVQLSGAANISMGVRRGMQLTLLANVASGRMRGLQMGAYNYSDSLRGSQIGLINVAYAHDRGVQVGVVNYTHDTIAHKIGLVNINPKTRIDILGFVGTSSIFNAGLRFRNHSTYNIIGMGTHYMGLDSRFSGALFYRIGQYFNLNRRWSLSGDLGFYHIETFEENSRTKPERLYSLQLHANVDYRINRSLGVFASLGYGDTRYYGHHRHYKEELIAQAGISVNWPRRKSTFNVMPFRERQKAPVDTTVALWNHGRKQWLKGAAEATGINVLVHCFDRFVMNEDFAQVHFKDIAHNWRHAFVWDNDQFSTNLFAHPYHGNLYFNSARSAGLSFWESAPYSLGGSLMWEFCGEVEPPAINDLMATTLGGICIGEVMHRVSELVLDNGTRGFNRFLREAAATIINPMGGFNRIISGDAWRVDRQRRRYYDKENLPIDFSISTGVRYLSDDGGMFRGEFNPYVNFYLEYGDLMDTDRKQPFDFFNLETTFGLSANQPLINQLHILGRLWGKELPTNSDMTAEIGIFQHFNYYDSKPVKNGTSLTPYRISEAAGFGPGFILTFPQVGALRSLQQRVFLSGILLGGTKSDYYNVIDRDYNMGSGFSVKTKTQMEFRNFGRYIMKVNYYRIFTWKGYEGKDLEHIDPLYLNAQGDKGNAELAEVTGLWEFDFKGALSASVGSSYFFRHTRYSFHKDVTAKTFELRAGLTLHF